MKVLILKPFMNINQVVQPGREIEVEDGRGAQLIKLGLAKAAGAEAPPVQPAAPPEPEAQEPPAQEPEPDQASSEPDPEPVNVVSRIGHGAGQYQGRLKEAKMSNRPAPPVMILGVNNIAKVLGVSPCKVRNDYLKRQDFPARRDGELGSWTTTRRNLVAWANKLHQKTERHSG